MTDRVKLIQDTLNQALTPAFLDIEDDSAAHAGHAGNTGGGHYNVMIVSDQFTGLTPIQRHRKVYEAVDHLMKTEIHALSLVTKTPSEV